MVIDFRKRRGAELIFRLNNSISIALAQDMDGSNSTGQENNSRNTCEKKCQ